MADSCLLILNLGPLGFPAHLVLGVPGSSCARHLQSVDIVEALAGVRALPPRIFPSGPSPCIGFRGEECWRDSAGWFWPGPLCKGSQELSRGCSHRTVRPRPAGLLQGWPPHVAGGWRRLAVGGPPVLRHAGFSIGREKKTSGCILDCSPPRNRINIYMLCIYDQEKGMFVPLT